LTNYLRDLFMGKPASVNARAYKEFWALNRVEGHTLLATLSISLVAARSEAGCIEEEIVAL